MSLLFYLAVEQDVKPFDFEPLILIFSGLTGDTTYGMTSISHDTVRVCTEVFYIDNLEALKYFNQFIQLSTDAIVSIDLMSKKVSVTGMIPELLVKLGSFSAFVKELLS